MPPIGPSSELTHAGRPYELTLLVSTVLVFFVFLLEFLSLGLGERRLSYRLRYTCYISYLTVTMGVNVCTINYRDREVPRILSEGGGCP